MIDARCGARAAKPQGWKLNRYPLCNRPLRHQLPHREYGMKGAGVLHEWYETVDLTDGEIRQQQRRTNAAEPKRIFG